MFDWLGWVLIGIAIVVVWGYIIVDMRREAKEEAEHQQLQKADAEGFHEDDG